MAYPKFWCFLDGAFQPFCRPYKGGYNGLAQRIHWTRHKRSHGASTRALRRRAASSSRCAVSMLVAPPASPSLPSPAFSARLCALACTAVFAATRTATKATLAEILSLWRLSRGGTKKRKGDLSRSFLRFESRSNGALGRSLTCSLSSTSRKPATSLATRGFVMANRCASRQLLFLLIQEPDTR